MGNIKFDDTSMKSAEEDSDYDADDCNLQELSNLFRNCACIYDKQLNNQEYILHITATSDSEPNVAITFSNQTCEVNKVTNSEVVEIESFKEHTKTLIGCKFSNRDNNLLYTTTDDGTTKLWDIRTPQKSELTFTDTTSENNKSKVFNSFDVSSNDRLLAAGTDIFAGDPFILFWDTRNQKMLGGYWESHTDDITQVKFHPEETYKLISGSTDGLINIYDLSQTCEEDALLDSLNTESSVDQLVWFNESNKWRISCITHVYELQLWTLEEAEPYKHFRRKDLTTAIRRKNEDFTYIASHQGKPSLLVLIGSNYNNGECLRGLQIKQGEILPQYGFLQNKQIVRCSWYNENTNMLFTGGENGILNVWKITNCN